MAFNRENVVKRIMLKRSVGTFETAKSSFASPTEIETERQKEEKSNWIFGVQLRVYPYEFLKQITECLKDFGFVTFQHSFM